MSKQVNWLLAAVVVLLLGVTCWLAQTAPAVAAMPQDERPPIVVYEGSIHFNHGAGWIRDPKGGPVWKPNLNAGGPVQVKGFDAIAVNRSASGACLARGSRLTIEYTVGSQKQQFTLSIDTAGYPMLTPPSGTTLVARGPWNLMAGVLTEGAITSVAPPADPKKPCTFQPTDDVRVIVKMS